MPWNCLTERTLFKGQIYNEYYGKGSNVVPDRQEYAHAHGAFTWGPYVYVADLGSDKIWKYKVQKYRKY